MAPSASASTSASRAAPASKPPKRWPTRARRSPGCLRACLSAQADAPAVENQVGEAPVRCEALEDITG